MTHRGQAGGDDVGKNPLGIEQEIQSTHEEILRVAFGPPSTDTDSSPLQTNDRHSHTTRTKPEAAGVLYSTSPPTPGTLLTLLKGRNQLHDTPDNHRQVGDASGCHRQITKRFFSCVSS